jgi:hypothetical protein
MADKWEYRIEAYRRIPGECAWEPAKDDTADMWLLLGDKGEDRRCFGAFSSRAGAEHGLEIAKKHHREQGKERGIER